MSDDDTPPARAFHPKRPINRKTKKHIVFDSDARREFLTGFRKRKLERKQKAEKKLEDQLKEERRRLKQEARESLRKYASLRPIAPSPEHPTENYDLENHSVSIVELSATDLAEKNNWIGPNRVQYEEDKIERGSENEEIKGVAEELPGMELKTVRELKIALKKKAVQEVKKSKVFQLKNRIEQQKNKKKSLQQKRKVMKIHKKNKKKGKHKGK